MNPLLRVLAAAWTHTPLVAQLAVAHLTPSWADRLDAWANQRDLEQAFRRAS